MHVPSVVSFADASLVEPAILEATATAEITATIVIKSLVFIWESPYSLVFLLTIPREERKDHDIKGNYEFPEMSWSF